MLVDDFCVSRATLLREDPIREAELQVVLRSLFEMLSQVLSPLQARDLLDTIRVYVMSVNRNFGDEKMSELVSEFWPVQPEPVAAIVSFHFGSKT